jgi:hypothetical protein
MNRILQHLRSADFLTRERIVLLSTALLIGFGVALLFVALTSHELNDYKGRPLGSDFSNIYAAGTYVLHGKPSAPFDLAGQYAREQLIFGRATPFFGWHYPPYFLFVAALLATLPYIPALLAWQVSTLLLYLAGIAALLRSIATPAILGDRLWLPLAVAFPAAFVNLIHGHNGFLTAALISGGLALLDAQPIVAGMLFGLLDYKPQFFVVVPILLIAGARWRALISTTATVVVLTTAVTVFFGVQVWDAFFASMHFTRTVVLEQGNTGFYKIQSVFAWVRLWGGSIPLAYTLQGFVAAAALLVAILAWRTGADYADRAAVLCVAAIMVTPYCLDYDLMIIAPAIAALAARGISSAFRPYEKTLLCALWLVPIVAREIAQLILVPLGVVLLVGMVAFLAAPFFRDRDVVAIARLRPLAES